MRPRLTCLALAAMLAACGAAPAASDEASPIAGIPSGAPPSVAAPDPSTEDVADGQPHPDGRIVFGRITSVDPVYGQVVALWAVDPYGGNLVQLNDGESAFPAWSPDGSLIAYTLAMPDGSVQIGTMAPDGLGVQVLTEGPGMRAWPSWSPDGSWIAYAYSPTLPDDPDWRTVIYRMNADGSGQELLGDANTFDVEPAVSPDGTSVLFRRDDDAANTSVLVVRDLETGDERVITAAGTTADHPSWSPDGQWIVYNIASWRTGNLADEHVMRVAADGSGEAVPLTDSTVVQVGFKPSYSPDGTRIVFGCIGLDGDDDALCLMDADGSNFEVLVDEPGVPENHFSWGVAAAR